MVQFRNGIKSLTPFALGALALYSCKDDEEINLNNDLLIGEWRIVSIDGEPSGEEYEGYSYSVGFKFEADGDFGYCYDYINNTDPVESYSYCEIDGEWEWLNDEQTELKLTQIEDDSEEYNFYMTISSITEDRIEGDLYTEDEPETIYDVVMEKFDFEE